MNYHTQMEAAKKGIITAEMKAVAKKEFRSEEEIRELVAKGQVVICANRLHKCIDPNGVGSMLRTKINVNLGVSRAATKGKFTYILLFQKKQTYVLHLQ